MRDDLHVKVQVLAALLLIVCQYGHSMSANKTNLYFSFITALSGGSTSSGGIPIVDFALEQINNDPRLLPDYNLQYTTVLDSECKSISALEGFLQHFDNATEPTYISSMCCGCSSATIPVAEISHHWNVPHISFASSSPILNNRERFKTFFRTLPCYVYIPPTVATIMKEFGWSQMAIITENDGLFNTAAEEIKLIFDQQGWRLKQTPVFDPSLGPIDYKQLLQWDEDHRIIMINTFEVHAYHIVCEAYRKYGQKLLDQKIVLMIHGRYMSDWWETAYTEVNSTCTREEVMEALNKTLALTPETYALMENASAVSYSGLTPAEFLDRYRQLLQEERYQDYSPLNFFGNAFDAMWVIAYGLHKVDMWAQNGQTDDECEQYNPGELVRLHEFEHTNRKMGCYMTKAFHEVDIIGITGPIMFKSDGSRPENVMRLTQHRVHWQGSGYSVTRPAAARVINEDNYKEGIIRVEYANTGSVVFAAGENYSTLWPGGQAPYDGSPIDVVEPTHLALTVIYCLLGILGLVFALVALVFNIAFRKRRVVKLGSPNLNFLIVAGSTMLYLALFFSSVSVFDLSQQLTETVLCNFRFWLFAVGNTLCFAVILAKQWRVYYIFSNPTPNKMIIKDWMLVIIVAVIVSVELIVMLVGTVIPESRLTAMPILVEELRQKEGVNEKVYVFTCANRKALIWIAISFGYKALLQLGAIFMAFTTRKVNIKGLKDTKEIYTIIYINTLIITVLIVTEFALKSHHYVYIVLYGLAIFAEATLFLALTFVPKAILLHADPDGKSVFTENDSQPTTNHFTVTNQAQETAGGLLTIRDVKARIAELQKQLALLEKEN